MAKHYPAIQKTFGSNVRIIRKSQNISQEVLAHMAGLDRSYIGQVERGERNICIKNIEKISVALNIDIKRLF